MSKMENTPGEMGFLGVDTTTAPLLLANGSLTKADEVVIRRNTQLESRVGFDVLTMKAARPFNTTAADSGNDEHFPMFPVNAFIPAYDTPVVGTERNIKCFVVSGTDSTTRYWGIADQVAGGGSIASFVYPTQDSPYMKSTSLTPVDPTAWDPGALVFTDTNYWGQNSFTFPTLRLAEMTDYMDGVEPRVVGNIYTTNKGPARFEEWESSYNDSEGLQTLNMGSRPLAVPQVPYVEPKLVPRQWSSDVTANSIYASNWQVSTLAYSALAFQKTNFGPPVAAPIQLRTPILPPITDGLVSGDELTLTLSDFGLVWTDGDLVDIIIDDSTVTEWEGMAAEIVDVTAPAAATFATGALSFDGNMANGELITIGSTVYKTVTSLVDPYDVLIGASASLTIANLIAAINKTAGEGTTYGTGTVIHPDVTASTVPGDLVATAKIAGTAGNSIATTTTSATSTWGAATLLGGAAAITTYTITIKDDLITGTSWSANAILKYRIAFDVQVDLYQPKESRFGDATLDNLLRAGFPIQTDLAADKVHNYKIYRTRPTIQELAVGPTDPGNELFECTRLTWGATDADTGMITVLDQTSNSQLGSFLYTNPSQQGSNGANTPPPLATISEVFNGYYFWAGFTERMPAVFENITPVGSDITLTETGLDDWAYTASTVEDLVTRTYLTAEPTNPYFLQFINRLPVETAARSLVRLINSESSIPYNAFYLGGFAGDGTIGLLPLCYRSKEYKLTSTDTSDWSFASPLEEDEAIYTPEIPKYRLRYSKFQIPHGTPDVNYLDLDTEPTIIALRTTSGRLNIITDAGIWELTGQSESNFDLRVRDSSAKCVMPGAVQVLNDNLLVMTTQGLRVYGSGTNISRPLDSQLFPLLTSITDVAKWAQNDSDDIVSSAIDDTNNEYMLFLRDVTKEENTNVMLRFSLMTNTWTMSRRDYSMGYFHPDYKRMIFGTRDGQTLIERNAQSILVGSDEIYPLVISEDGNITSIAQNSDGLWDVTGEFIKVSQWGEETPDGILLSKNHIVDVGDWIYWETFEDSTLIGAGKTDILKVVDVDAEDPDNTLQVYTIAVEIPMPSSTIKMWLIKPLKSEATFAPLKGENPTTVKKWSEVQIQSNGPRTSSVRLTTSTNEQRIERSHTVSNHAFSFGWNTYGWGSRPWGDPTNNAHPALRTYVPQPHGTSRSLTVELANVGFNEKLNIQAVSVVTDQKSTRVAR